MLKKATLEGKLLHPNDYLAAVEFQGRDVTLTIAGVKREDLKMAGGKQDTKPVLTFKETSKKLILNKTNASSIVEMYGSVAEDWIGKRVTFYPTRTACGRDMTDCIRVREVVPPAKPAAPENKENA